MVDRSCGRAAAEAQARVVLCQARLGNFPETDTGDGHEPIAPADGSGHGGARIGLAHARDLRGVGGAVCEVPWQAPGPPLDYLGRYTHRVAISNHRLVSVSDQQVRFRYKDYAHGNARKVLALDAAEFIRRFLLHVLPTGFMRIRHYEIIANRAKATKLTHARTALGQPSMPPPRPPESIVAFWLRIAQRNVQQCPYCRVGRMVVIAPLPTPRARAPPCHASR